MIGIYKITNNVNNKTYIGSSKNINKRWCEHKNALKHNKHVNKYLQDDYNLYGEDSFTYDVIVECNQTELKLLEEYYTLSYHSNNSNYGYNIEYIGNKHTDISKNKIHDNNAKSLKVKCDDKIYNSISDLAKENGIPRQVLARWLRTNTIPNIWKDRGLQYYNN